MTKIPNVFIENVKKLKQFSVLREEDDYLILTKLIQFVEFKEQLGNIFMPRSDTISKAWNIFFMVAFNRNFVEYDKFYEKGYPILILNSKCKGLPANIICAKLDNFVQQTFIEG